ncbi:MAG: hypothetical protein ACQEUZ_15620 [Pseudomonadota bacterium]
MAKAYIEALEVLVDSAKTSLALSAAPLALLFAKLESLRGTESVILKIGATIVLILFFFVSLASVTSLVWTRVLLAKEKLLQDGPPEKGGEILNWFEANVAKGQSIGEGHYVNIAEINRKFASPALVLAYLLGFVYSVIFLWI